MDVDRLQAAVRGLILVLWCAGAALAAPPHAAPDQPVYRVTVKGPIIPIVATYLERTLREAEADQAVLLVVLDTPGGLVTTTQDIVQRMLDARVPVVVYVSPQGAWAGSAGVFITLAGHVAAMAPGTAIGAAHPVSLGEPKMEDKKDAGRDYGAEKAEHHLAAFARSIAQRRGRNAEWAEKAVRESLSLTASEAVKQRVVDLMAETPEDLLRRIDGRKVTVGEVAWTLHPQGRVTRELPMSAVERFLLILSNPGLAAFLLMFGVYGIMYELLQPGAVLPAIVGGICLLLGLYALGQLPISYAGLGLLLLAAVLFISDLALPGHGFLSVGGIIAMVLGSILLVPSGHPYLAVSWGAIAAMVVVVGGGFMTLATVVVRSVRRAPAAGTQAMVGALGRTLSDVASTGAVRVRGEIWSARTPGDSIPPDVPVRVVDEEQLTLIVERVPAAGEERGDEPCSS